MGNAEELREPVSSVGFCHVGINSSLRAAYVGLAQEFIRDIDPPPFASLAAAPSDVARRAIFRELISGLSYCVVDGMLESPTACHDHAMALLEIKESSNILNKTNSANRAEASTYAS